MDYIKNCKCVILPSEWYENCPYSAMEAMAYGKPLIVSGNGGLPELVEEGKNGFVFASGVDALAEAIRKMMRVSADEYVKMSHDSLKKAKEMFDSDEYVTKLEGWYKAKAAKAAE